MKKFLLLIGLICVIHSVSAQTKTAYCDVYVRGGGLNLKVTISYNSNSMKYPYRKNIGEVLNELSSDGWVLDSNIVIPRHPLYSLFTRHKLHFIMKKEYQEGEDPFAYLSSTDLSSTEKVSIPKQIIEYHGLEVVRKDIDNNQAILLVVNGKTGTWNEAMEYCKSLGEGWRLPTPEEFKQIKLKLQINDYWTFEEVDDNKAIYYSRSYNALYKGCKSELLYIQPIVIVDISELE